MTSEHILTIQYFSIPMYSFKVLQLYVSHLVFIWVNFHICCEKGVQLHSFYIEIEYSQHHLFKRLFSHYIVLELFIKNQLFSIILLTCISILSSLIYYLDYCCILVSFAVRLFESSNIILIIFQYYSESLVLFDRNCIESMDQLKE